MRQVRLTVGGLVVAFALLAAAPASAQLEQGRLTGTVFDAQGAVLPGATVTATSAALIGTQTVVTEADGKYRFPALPSGRYTLTFELPGFRTMRRENIVLSIGQTLTVDARLDIATLEETVTVTSESPVVDLQSTKVGSEFSGEKLVGVPTATDIWATLGQAPGVRMRGFDVGGSHKSQQSGYESFGIRGQNRILNDGVDTTEGTSGAGFYADYFVNEEIAVSAAGGDVEMNTAGSAVYSSIKSGGNTFRSLNNLSYEGEGFVGDNLDQATAARGFTGQPNLIFWEGHTDLGGPIKRDKVWFYAAYNHFKIDKVISGVDRNLATDLGVFDNFTVKGTGKLSSRDTLIGYYQWGRKQKPNRGLSVTRGPQSILAQDSKSWVYKGEWQRVWTNRLFTAFRVGLFGYGWPMAPAVDWKVTPPRIDLDTSIETGAGWLSGSSGGPFSFDRNKPQVTATASYFLPDKAGSHDFKLGYEYFNDQSIFGNNGNSGPIMYRDRSGQASEIRITDLGTFGDFNSTWTPADDRNQHHALFVQDRWRATDRLTMTLGLRYDYQRPHYEASVRDPVLTEIFPANETAGKTLFTANKVAPRLGFAYDMGDGKSVLKAFYGRFYFNYADEMSGANPGGTNYADYVFNDLNGNLLYDGPQELGNLLSSSGGSSTSIDQNLKTPYTDEFNVSFDRQFWGESSVRVAYVRKMERNQFTTYNPAREGQFTIPIERTVTLRSFDGGVEGTKTYTLYDIPAGLPTTNIIAQIPGSVGGGSNNYDTLQFAVQKRFGTGLFVQTSYEFQWRDELRSPNSASTSPLTADPIGTGFHQNSLAQGDSGVPNRQDNTNWQYRLLGRYVLPYDVGIGVNWRVQSGWAYARRISVSLPRVGTTRFFEEPIQNNRSDTASLLDVRFDKAFVFDRYTVKFMADVYNLLNSNAVSNFNLLNGSSYNLIIATLDPRTAQVAVRFEF